MNGEFFLGALLISNGLMVINCCKPIAKNTGEAVKLTFTQQSVLLNNADQQKNPDQRYQVTMLQNNVDIRRVNGKIEGWIENIETEKILNFIKMYLRKKVQRESYSESSSDYN